MGGRERRGDGGSHGLEHLGHVMKDEDTQRRRFGKIMNDCTGVHRFLHGRVGLQQKEDGRYPSAVSY